MTSSRAGATRGAAVFPDFQVLDFAEPLAVFDCATHFARERAWPFAYETLIAAAHKGMVAAQGSLQETDADRAHVIAGLALAGGNGAHTGRALANTLKRLAPRWFLMRDAHASEGTVLLQPRWAMPFMLGPMMRSDIRRALAARESDGAVSRPPRRLLAQA